MAQDPIDLGLVARRAQMGELRPGARLIADGWRGATPVKSSEYAGTLGLSRIRSVRAELPSVKTTFSTVCE